MPKRKLAAQIAVAKKATALKDSAHKQKLPPTLTAANQAHLAEAGLAPDILPDPHDRKRVHGARAPPVRLLDKAQVCAVAGVSFPTIWSWMRQGRFPRARVVGGAGSCIWGWHAHHCRGGTHATWRGGTHATRTEERTDEGTRERAARVFPFFFFAGKQGSTQPEGGSTQPRSGNGQAQQQRT